MTCFDLTRSSSGPPRRQIQELYFSTALGSVVLSTDVLCLYVITLRDGKHKIYSFVVLPVSIKLYSHTSKLFGETKIEKAVYEE